MTASSLEQDPKTLSIRHILEQRRAALIADIRHDLHDACTGVETVRPDDAMDMLDAGAVTAQSDIHFDLMSMRSDTLVAVDEALARIDDGCYGICESCGRAIAEKRLRAMPFALRCTHCEELREDRERGRRAHDQERQIAHIRRAISVS